MLLASADGFRVFLTGARLRLPWAVSLTRLVRLPGGLPGPDVAMITC